MTGSKAAGDDRRQVWLDHFAQHGEILAACGAAGVTIHTYRAWRRRHRDFAAIVDGTRANRMAEGDVAHFQGGFAQFRKIFFGMDSPPFHLEIVNAMEYAEPGSITMILCPPEHGKTSISEDWDSMKLAEDPNFRITVGSEGQPHARKILRRIQSRMTDKNIAPHYMARYGPFYEPGQERKGKPWGADYFTVNKASHDERDYSMEARGMTSAIAGTRTDRLQIDDPQSARSLNLTDRLLTSFRQDWLSRPGSEGSTIVLGTRVGPQDFYEQLLELDIVDRLIQYPAILPDGSPLWPHRWPLEKLEKKRRQVGEDAWWRNYMQQPLAGATQTFPLEILTACQAPLLSVTSDPDDVAPLSRYERAIGVDPAIGGGNALVAAAYTPQILKILNARVDFGLGRMEQILDRLHEWVRLYRPGWVVIEAKAFQTALSRDERLLAMSRTYGFRVREHMTGRDKADPDFGVAAMATSVVQQRIEFPGAADHITRDAMVPYLNEFVSWRPGVRGNKLVQDRVMATWFVWRLWRDRCKALRVSPASFQRKALPWKPTRVPMSGGVIR